MTLRSKKKRKREEGNRGPVPEERRKKKEEGVEKGKKRRDNIISHCFSNRPSGWKKEIQDRGRLISGGGKTKKTGKKESSRPIPAAAFPLGL